MKLILVDGDVGSPTVGALRAGVADYVASNLGRDLQLQIVPLDDVEGLNLGEENDVKILFSLGNTPLSSLGDNGLRVPSPELARAYYLADQNPTREVYLVQIPGPNTLSGVDIMAGMLAGIAGFVDERALLTAAAIGRIVSYAARTRRSVSALIMGQAVQVITSTKNMVDEWDSDCDADPTLDVACWRACLALAQLPRLQPIVGSGDPYSAVKLAAALNLAEHMTGFRLTEADLRKVIGILSRRLLGADHHSAQRVTLPNAVRHAGFPSTPAAKIGVSGERIAAATFHALREAMLVAGTDIGTIQQLELRIGIGEYRSRSLRSRPQGNRYENILNHGG